MPRRPGDELDDAGAEHAVRRRQDGAEAGFFYPTDRTEPPASGSG